MSERLETLSDDRVPMGTATGLCMLFMLTTAAPAAVAQTFVAGTTPAQRRQAAPRVQAPDRPANWHAKAVAGISNPIPPSLRFLDDQGAWYTPFTRPGMPGPYDIRGLHGAAPQATAPPAKR